MKFSTLSAIAALMLAAALSACGGKAQFAVQGTISGLGNPGLVLANGSDTLNVPAGALSFTMPRQIPYGTEYNITVQHDPDHQTCQVVAGASGSAGHTVSIAAQVLCQQKTYNVSGQFIGLFPNNDATATTAATPRIVVLTNGSAGGTVSVSSASALDAALGKGNFQFDTKVPHGIAYGVTILSQPADLNCSLTGGTGVINDADASNLLLTCKPK
ncbi:hypothetical protein [Duganella sp. HH101]|uniref:hypothetical protein n=1 Tax=Duganella sp. HH101 TaxID=1781066 RepID=UPI0008742852|nr:hypothetical protein [Duganella sp. HH101]OEZ99807.1 hypothetical protein DUGA2_52530 [Duganella sp. HH101]